MIRKTNFAVFFTVICLLFILFAFADEEEKKFDREQFNNELRKAIDRRNYPRAIELLNEALDRFPDRLHMTTWLLAQFYARTVQHKKCMEILEYGHSKGVWYNFEAAGNTFIQISQRGRFKKIIEKNEELKEEAQERSEPQLDVREPVNYNRQKKYPLCIAFNGAGDNIKSMKRYFNSGILEDEYLVAFIQSSQMTHTNGYHWANLTLARKEIKDLYEDLVDDYNIEEDRTILSGISQGGTVAIDISINRIIPNIGFVAFCPAYPRKYELEKYAKESLDYKLSGYIVTGEHDYLLPGQREMHRVLNKIGFVHEFQILPNLGHGLPDDFKERLDKGIKFINDNAKEN